MLSTQILKYDPLVSDTACHVRACYLVSLARKSKTTRLSEDEQSYLEACDLLTQTQSRKKDVFGVITDERTDINNIPVKYLPSTASNGKKNTLLATTKAAVAKKTLTFLQAACSELVLNGDPEIFTFTIPTYSQRIPVLPLYVSSKMMLHYASKQAIPLAVNLKRLSLQDGNYVLDGAVSLTYVFSPEAGKFTLQEAKEDVEVLAIDMVSCHVKGTEAEVGGFLAAPSFQAYLEAFQREDIAALIMLAAAGHPAYPPSAEPPKVAKPGALMYKEPGPAKAVPLTVEATPVDEIKAPAADKIKVEESLEEKASAGAGSASGKPADSPSVPTREVKGDGSSPLRVSLTECSELEFKQLVTLARQYGFFRPKAQYVTADLKAGKLSRAKTCLPFFIDHVSASTVGECQTAIASLQAARATLKAPQEEVLVIDKPKGKVR